MPRIKPSMTYRAIIIYFIQQFVRQKRTLLITGISVFGRNLPI